MATRKRRRDRKVDGISRIDSEATHGWFVRVYRDGKTHDKFFSDLKNGGKGKARRLAPECRDEMRSKLGLPSPHAHRSCEGTAATPAGASASTG